MEQFICIPQSGTSSAMTIYGEEAITYALMTVFMSSEIACKYNKFQNHFTIKFENKIKINEYAYVIKLHCFVHHNSFAQMYHRYSYPDQSIQVKSSVLRQCYIVGAEFGAVTGTVHAQFLNQSDSKLYPLIHQYTQRIDNFRKCKVELHSEFTHLRSQEVLVLTSSNGKVLTYRDRLKIESETRYNEKQLLYNIAPLSALYTPVYINLTILPCPQGFQLIGSPPKCDCIPALIENDMFCKFTNGIGYIYRSGTQWVGIYLMKRDAHLIIVLLTLPVWTSLISRHLISAP